MIKKYLLIFASALSLLPAQDSTRKTKEQLINQLMETRDKESFELAYQQGVQFGLSQQTLLEARFLFLVDEGKRSSLAAFAPMLQKQLPDFNANDSTIFATLEDFQSIVEYTLALASLERNEEDAFKKHITEAFWLSPTQAGLFEPLITETRIKNAMKNLKLDLSILFKDQTAPSDQTTLKQHLGNSKAILLYFWSPWIEQSLEAMEEYSQLSKALMTKKIPSTFVLLNGVEESINEANLFLEKRKTQFQGHWIIDNEKDSLVSLFRIQNFPTVVLLSHKGTVLFNGHLKDPVLKERLDTLSSESNTPKDSPSSQ